MEELGKTWFRRKLIQYVKNCLMEEYYPGDMKSYIETWLVDFRVFYGIDPTLQGYDVEKENFDW